MRLEKIYKFNELSEEAKQKAINDYRDNNHEIFWQDELTDSLKAVFEKSGIKLIDYSLGLNRYSYVKFDMDENIENLTGVRALTWLENNFLSQLRISRSEWVKRCKDYLSYGKDYRQGKIKPCPLTGYCADESFIESLINDIKSGCTLKEAYKNLADTYVNLLQSEYDSQNEDSYISEHLEINDYEFLESGKRF